MSKGKCADKNPLQRDGTSRQQRLPDALLPGAAPLYEFTIADWMKFAWHYAADINFYSKDDSYIAGNWQKFFVQPDQIKAFMDELQQERQTTAPHLALFVCFLQLIARSQVQLNGLTERHLDFYYEQVLGFAHQQAVPDRVFVLFELAKNAVSEHLAKATLLDAGNDAAKKPLRYELTEDLVVNTATVGSVKAMYHKRVSDSRINGEKPSLRYADIANSLNGLGAPMPAENPAWYAFGHGRVDGLPDLPVAKVGFALASAVLLLKEGERSITVTIALSGTFANAAAPQQIVPYFTALLTGEKGWIKADMDATASSFNVATQELVIKLIVSAKEKAIISYNAAIHQEHFTTTSPVLRLLLQPDATQTESYSLYQQLSGAAIKYINITTAVTNAKSVSVENDIGVLDVTKPFLPFGTAPKAGANFLIGYPEALEKDWTSVTVDIVWKAAPESFTSHYMAYQKSYLKPEFVPATYILKTPPTTDKEVENNAYFKTDVWVEEEGVWTRTNHNESLFSDTTATAKTITIQRPPAGNKLKKEEDLLLASGRSEEKGGVINFLEGGKEKERDREKERAREIERRRAAKKKKPVTSATGVKADTIKLELQNSFLHEFYPRLYAAALSTKDHDVILPMEPYTPVIASLLLSYAANAQHTFNKAATAAEIYNDYQLPEIELFHEGPFGQSEQHPYLKMNPGEAISLLPVYPSEGELYVGLQQAAPATIVSLLFNVAEGSENPVAPSFTAATGGIQWMALCNNEWKNLDTGYLLSDSTNNFLRPGIIRFLLPDEITANNTILPGAYSWLMGRLPNGLRFDSVGKCTLVAAQAAEAVFTDNGNELSHLDNHLPVGTITKLPSGPAGIKKVVQPLASFGGRPVETANDFYTRVSERLRHKNRAVNIWDYERLVLQQFPEVYKVKCLNHTSLSSATQEGHELDPGYVTIIPLPSVRNKMLYDVLKPRLPVNTLREVENYVRGLASMHVEVAAAHPDFEEITCTFSVKFYPQYDPKAYVKILNEDLKKYLAPWAYDEFADISFGGALHKSVVIGFIEDREYVDFVSAFVLSSDAAPGRDKSEIIATHAAAILTSAQVHAIAILSPELICTTA